MQQITLTRIQAQNIVFSGKQKLSKQKTEFTPSKEFEQYKSAKNYVNLIIRKKGAVNLKKCNLDKLEGIQHGIKVFDGLSIKQIALLQNELKLMTLFRGCTNGCTHCLADAKPPVEHKQTKLLQTMPWEDFKSITSAFHELNKRLGDPQSKNINKFKVIAPFIDSDCLEIILKDAQGNSYDIIDIARAIKDDMGTRIIFDTSGWNPKSPTMQKRAEKYVADIAEDLAKGKDKAFNGINISLNPFHKLNSKYIELINTNPEKAKFYRDIYTTRMANVFYTFTPILDKPEVKLLNRALPNDYDGINELFKEDAHKQLIQEIRTKLEARYKQDNLTPQEVAKNLELFDKKTTPINTSRLEALGRMKNIFKSSSDEVKAVEKRDFAFKRKPLTILNRQNYSGLCIDSNGQVYITDFQNKLLTDIKLNTNSKNKITPQLFKQHLTISSTKNICNELKYLQIKNKIYGVLRTLIKASTSIFKKIHI